MNILVRRHAGYCLSALLLAIFAMGCATPRKDGAKRPSAAYASQQVDDAGWTVRMISDIP